MTKEEKIRRIVNSRLDSMDLEDLELFYRDACTYDMELYASNEEIDEIYVKEFEDEVSS